MGKRKAATIWNMVLGAFPRLVGEDDHAPGSPNMSHIFHSLRDGRTHIAVLGAGIPGVLVGFNDHGLVDRELAHRHDVGESDPWTFEHAAF